MNKRKLYNALSGLRAYDEGFTDSGIHDEDLRQEVVTYLNGLDKKERRIVLSNHIRDVYLSKEAIEQGYGIADVKEFIEWIKEWPMDIDI